MFKTARCTINKLQVMDYVDVEKIYVNREVRKFLGGTHEKDSISVMFEEMLNSSPESFYWMVREKQTESAIGLVSLDLHHEGVHQEISYQFLPCWWGKGYASEAVSMIINFALYELNHSIIIAETQTANKASCRLLERLGMERECTVFRFGAEQVIYSIKAR